MKNYYEQNKDHYKKIFLHCLELTHMAITGSQDAEKCIFYSGQTFACLKGRLFITKGTLDCVR